MSLVDNQEPLQNPLQDEEYKQRIRKLAHDLRTPIGVICMGLQLMETVRHDDEQFKTIHQFMESAGKELIQLIDAMAAETVNNSTEEKMDGL